MLFNLLRGMYSKNPVRIDIAGTIESIAEINAGLLYSCYNTFYNLSNMALAVVGNVKKETVLGIVDRVIKPESPVKFEQIIPEEPKAVAEKLIEETMGVDMPKFALGFKDNLDSAVPSAKKSLTVNIALDIIAGKVSPLYSELMEKGLINPTFSKEYFAGRGFAAPMFSGESAKPEAVKDAIISKIEEIKKRGISDEDFNVSLKKMYGMAVLAFNDVDDMANNIIDAYFNGQSLFDTVELYKSLTKEDVEKAIAESFDTDNCCLSVIK